MEARWERKNFGDGILEFSRDGSGWATIRIEMRVREKFVQSSCMSLLRSVYDAPIHPVLLPPSAFCRLVAPCLSLDSLRWVCAEEAGSKLVAKNLYLLSAADKRPRFDCAHVWE